MSYGMQIDMYGNRDGDLEQAEKQDRRRNKKGKGILLLFLILLFVFYSKDMFTRTLMDRTTIVRIEEKEDVTEYLLIGGMITVQGEKNAAEEAKLTISAGDMPSEEYTIRFSDNTDWEHSMVTVTDGEGEAVYLEQLDGADKIRAAVSNQEASLAKPNRYGTLITLALREGTRFRGNILLYAAVWLLIIAEGLSHKLWRWAVDRNMLPSQACQRALLIGRFLVFLLILVLSILSYSV